MNWGLLTVKGETHSKGETLKIELIIERDRDSDNEVE